jgi:hypothetical protein
MVSANGDSQGASMIDPPCLARAPNVVSFVRLSLTLFFKSQDHKRSHSRRLCRLGPVPQR